LPNKANAKTRVVFIGVGLVIGQISERILKKETAQIEMELSIWAVRRKKRNEAIF
jgi:hypothetical protein